MLKTYWTPIRWMAIGLVMSLCACESDSSADSNEVQDVNPAALADTDGSGSEDTSEDLVTDTGPMETSDTLAGQTDVLEGDALEGDVLETDVLETDAAQPPDVVENEDPLLEIHLTWSAPGDPDPTDQGPEAGPDLDLHFKHSFAEDWFDQPFDCFWFNPHPNWGDWDHLVEDDPILTLDSTDGSGPEQLLFDAPEEGAVYGVGVHVWSDHGFGPIEAQLTISVGGSLAYEATVTLENQDFWEVATFDGTTGQLEILGDEAGDPLIVSDYDNPFFGEP